MNKFEQNLQESARFAATSIGETAYSFWSGLGIFVEFVGECASAVWHAVSSPRSIRKRETLYYLNMCGPAALPICIMICLLTGVIVGYQSAVQMHKYGADAFLPALVGCSIVRELSPLMIAIIASGRAGSAFTAEIAAMKANEELNAMITMGLSPWRFLVIPKLIAMTVMQPLLTLFGNIVGIIGGMFVGVMTLYIPPQAYYEQTIYWVHPKFFIESLTKAAVFGVIVTIISCLHGFQANSDSIGIGKATTSSVVSSIVAIVLADAVLAKIFNFIFYGV